MPFNIGANPNPNDHSYFSNIDVYQAAIFDRVLSDEEIKMVIDNNYTNIDTFSFLLDKKTMYKLKEED